jgi:hypothetical protein
MMVLRRAGSVFITRPCAVIAQPAQGVKGRMETKRPGLFPVGIQAAAQNVIHH